MASRLISIPFSQLEEDPKNIRRSYTAIDELAHTIYEHGLLQNLIVVQIAKDRYVVKDGNRRRRAFARLIEAGHWDNSQGINCLLLDGEGSFEQLVAEVQKQEAPIWHLGFRFIEFEESGLSQKQIANYIGRSPGFVSRAQQISSNLAPETIKRLDDLPAKALTAEQVHRVSVLVNPVTKKADVQAQLSKIQSFIDLPRVRRQPGKHGNRDRNLKITKRFYHLKTALKIPAHAAKTVNAVIDYLDGTTTRLKL
jgi:ParB/RepB/Spo0J family partition protein